MRARRGAISPIPVWVGLLGTLAFAYLGLPLFLMGARVPWSRLPALLVSEAALDAICLSVKTSLAALAIDVLLGVPAAVLLSRDWRGVRAARVLVALPLSLPPVVAGMALLSAFGRRSPFGGSLEAIGVDIAFSSIAVVMAQVFVSLPFLVVTLESALRSRSGDLEKTAASLGARPTRILFSATLPCVVPALARGSALALARSLGEFGATLTFAGSLQGVTRTLPLQIYLARESDTDLALALGAVLLGAALVVVTLTEAISTPRPRSVPEDEDEVEGALERRNPATDPDTAPPREPVEVRVHGRVESRGWGVYCALPAGRVTAVMGRNGSGKSTLAGVVAGALALDEGEARIGRVLVDGDGVFVPARARSVAVVDQHPRLFGWKRVIDEVAFPLRARGVPRAEARARARVQLDAVGCGALAERRGDSLSGGQTARVALARALVFDPEVLVLDEPTASLDVEAAARVASVIARRLDGERITALLITHDIVEALALASRLLILEEGHVVEEGAPSRILASPSSLFGARLAGLNIVRGEALPRIPGSPLVSVALADGRLTGVVDSTRRAAGTCGRAAAASEAEEIPRGGAPVALLFAPEAVILSREPVAGSPRTVLRARIRSVEASADSIAVDLEVAGTPIRARLTAAAWAELELGPGSDVWCAIKAMQVRAIPLASPVLDNGR